jgi:hypothetical protein
MRHTQPPFIRTIFNDVWRSCASQVLDKKNRETGERRADTCVRGLRRAKKRGKSNQTGTLERNTTFFGFADEKRRGGAALLPIFRFRRFRGPFR